MNKKVTIQDIADELGISRNTVSKAINNAEGIADATREKILQKAVEMGYKQFSYFSAMTNIGKTASEHHSSDYSGEIAIFTTGYLANNHFASTFLDRFHQELAQVGFSISTHRISSENMHTGTLPRTFVKERITGIVCVEVFDQSYSELICSIGLPVLFVDCPVQSYGKCLDADILMMDNTTEITRFVNLMLDRGLKRIGFIGDYDHCQSFYERYRAFRMAMMMRNVPVEDRFIIKIRNSDVDALGNALDVLDELPDAFICSNDFSAIDAMQLLAQKDRKLLSQVRFLGFDDTHESRIFYPPISSVHIHSQVMSFSALHLLMSRINEPTMDFRTIYCETDLVLRESTEF